MTTHDKKELQQMIGITIKYERIKLQLSVQQLAEILDLSPQMIISIERGARGTTIENLIKIANLFNVTLDYLVGREETALSFSSPTRAENPKKLELRALCESLDDDQIVFALKFIKDLITYTNDLMDIKF